MHKYLRFDQAFFFDNEKAKVNEVQTNKHANSWLEEPDHKENGNVQDQELWEHEQDHFPSFDGDNHVVKCYCLLCLLNLAAALEKPDTQANWHEDDEPLAHSFEQDFFRIKQYTVKLDNIPVWQVFILIMKLISEQHHGSCIHEGFHIY